LKCGYSKPPDLLVRSLTITRYFYVDPAVRFADGRVEWLNGRISEVLATHRFDSRASLEATIQRYVWLYNHHIPQKALGHVPPIEAMKRWYAEKAELFIKIPRNRPRPDT
jgi:hypothetical protein